MSFKNCLFCDETFKKVKRQKYCKDKECKRIRVNLYNRYLKGEINLDDDTQELYDKMLKYLEAKK